MTTSTSTSTSTSHRPVRRVLRGERDRVADHAFDTVGDLPSITLHRPTSTGDRHVDAVRAAAWDEGLAMGRAEGLDEGRSEGFAQGRDDGFRAGQAEGLAAGRAAAAEEARAQVSGALDALESAATELAARDAVALGDIEETVVDLALQLAATILERELTVAADPGGDAIRRALRLAPERGDLVVRLHPADLARLDAADLAPGRALELVGDRSIPPGGCLVETEAARVDARIESALERARTALLGADDEGSDQ